MSPAAPSPWRRHGAARRGEIKTLAPRRRLSLSSTWRGGWRRREGKRSDCGGGESFIAGDRLTAPSGCQKPPLIRRRILLERRGSDGPRSATW
uniref:Pco108434 n=1 Tax=Arundo donax TaxID=35708 RepID=A0A0A9GLN6_ARUDO